MICLKQTKDELIITALVSNPTIKTAALACGVSESLIYRKLRDPPFREKYDKARLEMLERNTAALQGHLGTAIQAMADIVEDEKTAPQTKLNAADAIIRNSLKLTEQTDILRRLDALERAQK